MKDSCKLCVGILTEAMNGINSKLAIAFVCALGVIAIIENGTLNQLRQGHAEKIAVPIVQQRGQVNMPAQPAIQTVLLTTEWSKPIYLPDPLVKVADFSCDVDEYGVLYDVLVNGKYLYGSIAKDQPVSIKETCRFLQWRISADSPAKTGTMRYRITPR